jgi:hypothetical protein
MPPKSYSQLPGHELSKTKVDVSGERLRKWWFQGPQDALDHDKQLQDAAAACDLWALMESPRRSFASSSRRSTSRCTCKPRRSVSRCSCLGLTSDHPFRSAISNRWAYTGSSALRCSRGVDFKGSCSATGRAKSSRSPSSSDSDQDLSGIRVQTPPGLLGMLRSVVRCPEPQASQGACAPQSLIGHTTVAAGSGPDPVWIRGGEVFLTGPYGGAPFGLSVLVPARAGPFDLGTVVIRFALRINPSITP